MSNDSTSLEVRAIVAEILGLEEVLESASQETLTEWDSMAYLSIVSALEDTFEIDITEENINDFGSVEKIILKVLECKQ